MHIDAENGTALQPLLDEGWITEILYEVKSGKEATVFCCRGGAAAQEALLAAKVYRPLETRSFRNDAAYLGGRLHMVRAGRVRRAVERGSAFGRQVQQGTWVHQEWEVLRRLHQAGAAVPRPLALAERAILLPFYGDESGPAPLLHETAPTAPHAARIVDELLGQIELMLDYHVVHGDLSPFNVLLHEERPIVIDLPQAVDPRLNDNARALLERDVEQVCRWGARHGAARPAAAIAARLWSRFVEGEIG